VRVNSTNSNGIMESKYNAMIPINMCELEYPANGASGWIMKKILLTAL
jgi:hypothetical protein